MGGDEIAASEPDRRQNAGRSLDIELVAAGHLQLAGRIELAVAARRFATTFTAWLYSHRREIEVAPIASELRQRLESEPPYVPPRQVGTGKGRVVRVQVFVQTPMSAMLVVTVRDSRATYAMPAAMARRAGRWRIVRLNTH
jgi:hypothetical protein